MCGHGELGRWEVLGWVCVEFANGGIAEWDWEFGVGDHGIGQLRSGGGAVVNCVIGGVG